MESTDPIPARAAPHAAAVPFALSLAPGVASYVATGPSLGLYFAGVILATLLTPPLVLAHDTNLRRVFAGGAVVDAVALVWLVAAMRSETTLLGWLACYLVLVAFAFALAGIALALSRCRVNRAAASAIAVTLGLLWLTWPVWLSPHLAGTRGTAAAAWLVPAHPAFAINGALPQFEAWDRQRIAYQRLTNLNQDVFYTMPRSVTASVLVHATLGAMALLLARLVTAPRARRAATPGAERSDAPDSKHEDGR